MSNSLQQRDGTICDWNSGESAALILVDDNLHSRVVLWQFARHNRGRSDVLASMFVRFGIAMAKSKSPPLPPTPEAREHILVKVRAAAEPVDARTLAKQVEAPFQFTAKELTPVLDDFTARGILIRYPGKTAKGADRYWDRDLNAIGRIAAIEALEQFELPVSAKEIAARVKGPFKFTEKDLTPILDAAVLDGRIHRFAPKTARGKTRYWCYDTLEFGCRLAVQTLNTKGPLTAAKLQAALKELDNVLFEQVFQSLRDAGTLFVHPPVKTGAELFGIRPPAPEAYLKNVQLELTKTVKKLRDAHVSPDVLRRAIVQLVESAGISFNTSKTGDHRVETSSVDLIGLMNRLESGAARGSLVSARDLRRAAGLPKTSFDQAVLDLARAGEVSLHKHDYPASLTDAERDELVTDGNGNYFVGVAVRQPAV